MDEKLVSRMKELTKLSKENGNIVPVSEAFKKFPVEEEVHKGDIVLIYMSHLQMI
jgi:hypothetical protein